MSKEGPKRRVSSENTGELEPATLVTSYHMLLHQRQKQQEALCEAQSAHMAEGPSEADWHDHDEYMSREITRKAMEENTPVMQYLAGFGQLQPASVRGVLDMVELVFREHSYEDLPALFGQFIRRDVVELVLQVLPLCEETRILDTWPGTGLLLAETLARAPLAVADAFAPHEPAEGDIVYEDWPAPARAQSLAGFNPREVFDRLLPNKRVAVLSGTPLELLGQLPSDYDLVLCVPANTSESMDVEQWDDYRWYDYVSRSLRLMRKGGSFAALVSPRDLFDPAFREFLTSPDSSLKALVSLDTSIARPTHSEMHEKIALDQTSRGPETVLLLGWGEPSETMRTLRLTRDSDTSVVARFIRGEEGDRQADTGGDMLVVERRRFFGIADAIRLVGCAEAQLWKTVPLKSLSECVTSVGRCEALNVWMFADGVYIDQSEFSPDRLYFSDELVRPRPIDRVVQGVEETLAYLAIDGQLASPRYLDALMSSKQGENLVGLICGRLRGLLHAGADDTALADALTDVKVPLPELHDQLRIVEMKLLAEDLAEDPMQIIEHPDAVAEIITRVVGNPLNSLEASIYESYPFPIAFPYHLLGTVLDLPSFQKEQLRVAENLLAYLASVAACLVPSDHRDEIRADLRDLWQGGIGPGDWLNLARQCTKVAYKYSPSGLAGYLQALRMDSLRSPVGASLDALVRAKNDHKHDRAPNAGRAQQEFCDAVGESLRTCYEHLSFLTRYPHILIIDVDAVRGSKNRVRLAGLALLGSHPGHRKTEFELGYAIPKNDVCLQLENGDLLSLYPFIHGLTCTKCTSREYYFVDRWDARKESVVLKSFERGHTMESTSLRVDLESWKSSR